MVTIRINPRAGKAIKDAGVWEKFRYNLIKQWNYAENWSGNSGTVAILEGMTNVGELINRAFVWDETPEGQNFWRDIRKNY